MARSSAPWNLSLLTFAILYAIRKLTECLLICFQKRMDFNPSHDDMHSFFYSFVIYLACYYIATSSSLIVLFLHYLLTQN